MKNMYEEMSKGAYTVTGQASPWIKVPHSEAYYGARACGKEIQDMSGHPSNPLGPGQLAIDAVNSLAAADPAFPWADYDVEDVADSDGDGNFAEPDGVVDHLVLVHAGKDKSSDGGAEGPYAIWAHSSAVAGGYQVPGKNVKISNYIVQPEDSGVGVFAHEYGHDLGLPDLYDTSGQGSSAVDFWDLMSSGSHSGPIFQSMPTHMGLWDKWILGWANPKVFNPGDRARAVTVGQSSRTPKLTEDGVRVNLDSAPLEIVKPHSGTKALWSNLDQEWGDSKITREVQVPAGTDVKFWLWNNYEIEQDWDFGFVEVSADGGTTYTQQKVYAESGALVSTDDSYDDPNKNLAKFGNRKYGLTGNTDGWRHDYVDLTPFAGKTVKLRLVYDTDAAFTPRGWHADDFALTDGTQTVWSDDVEGGLGDWSPSGGTFTNTHGQGWVVNDGQREVSRFYLAEWRNFDGFDKGLQYAYDTNYSRDGAWKVEKFKYNAPGLLVWYRDSTFTNNSLVNNLELAPSIGSRAACSSSTRTTNRSAVPAWRRRRTASSGTTCRDASRPATRPSPSVRPTPSPSAWRRRASRSASTAPSSARSPASPSSPTPRPGTRAWRSVTGRSATATSTPRWSSRPRATSPTAPGSSTPTAPPPPSCTAPTSATATSSAPATPATRARRWASSSGCSPRSRATSVRSST